MNPAPHSEYMDLARTKLEKVLGAEEGRAMFSRTLRESSLESINSPDDLYTFSQQLAKQSGFASAIAAMLSLTAVLRGASAR